MLNEQPIKRWQPNSAKANEVPELASEGHFVMKLLEVLHADDSGLRSAASTGSICGQQRLSSQDDADQGVDVWPLPDGNWS